MTKIILWGELGDRFCQELEAEVTDLRDALRCLFANFPDFKNYLIDSEDWGQKYQVTAIASNWSMQLNENMGDFPLAGKTVVIAPVMAGAGAVGRFIGGIALIGIGILTGGTGLLMAGIAMTLQSVFFGNPKKPKEEQSSLVFSGQTTTTAEGNSIPIICGRYLVGVQIISFSVRSEYAAV